MSFEKRVYKMPRLVSVSLMPDGTFAPAMQYPTSEQWRKMIQGEIDEYLDKMAMVPGQIVIRVPTEEIVQELSEQGRAIRCKLGWIKIVCDERLELKESDLPYVIWGTRTGRYA